jgi:hypothetical protein
MPPYPNPLPTVRERQKESVAQAFQPVRRLFQPAAAILTRPALQRFGNNSSMILSATFSVSIS